MRRRGRLPCPRDRQRVAPSQRRAHSGPTRIHKQAARGRCLLQRQQAHRALQHPDGRDAVGRVVAHAARHGAQQLQHLAVGIAGAVVHGLARSRLGADLLRLGPAARELGVRHHGLQLQLRHAGARPPYGGDQVEITLGPPRPCNRLLRHSNAQSTVPLLQPVKKAGLGLGAGQGLLALLHGLERIGSPRGRRALRRIAVRGLQGQGHGVFAVRPHGTTAIARPLLDLAVGRKHQLHRHLIRVGQAALHFPRQGPAPLGWLPNTHAHHVGLAVQLHAPLPRALVALGLQ